MFSTPPKGQTLFVEPLEARIAPTNLIALANDPTQPDVVASSQYVTYTTAPGVGKLGFVPGSTFGVAGANIFALKLTGDNGVDAKGHSTGDQLLIYNPATGFNNDNPFLQAANGSLIAFFQDKNGDNEVQTNELTGLSLGKGASATVNGNVNGDIVTNLNGDGTISLTSAGNQKHSIGSLNIVGNVVGSILSGGSINNVSLSGSVLNVHAGSAVAGESYHLGDPNTITGTLAAAILKTGKTGPSINTASFLSVNDVHAGDGGFGGLGGSVVGLTLQSDTAGFNIIAGNGGDGDGAFRPGDGGSIATVLVKGVIDNTPNGSIVIQAGHGGADPSLKGGAGGSVSGVATSFDAFDQMAGTSQVSAVLLSDNILVQGGDGGMGIRGGKGGAVTDSLIYGSIPDAANADEIQVLGGHGGAAFSLTQGHGGAGGSVSQITSENLDADAAAAGSSIFVHGGDGGAGKHGGDVDALTLLGTNLIVAGGTGGDGLNRGGTGGSLNTINVLDNTLLFVNNLTLDAGAGGVGDLGKGGSGGNILTVRLGAAQLTSLSINDGTHADGGQSNNSRGGDGGTVTDVQITDEGSPGSFLSTPNPTLGTVLIRTGVGGNGLAGGGLGGDLGNFQLLGSDFSFAVNAGGGGSVLAGGHGHGGAGGGVTSLGVANESFNDANLALLGGATGAVAAGAGGNGARGGKGGDLVSVALRTAADVSLTAGGGGLATRGKAGVGGNIADSVGSSLLGGVSGIAGNAGMGGSKAVAGGAINSFIAAAGGNVNLAAANIVMAAGNGASGGTGGDILNSGTGLSELTQLPFAGSLTVTAGNGSSLNGIAGMGGSIRTFNGSIGRVGRTSLSAGAGGGGANETASGAGGVIDEVTLLGPGTVDGPNAGQVLVTLDGGDAGAAGSAKRGGAGGSVTNVTISGLAANSLVQHVAGGTGAAGLKRGGAGGAIGQIHVGGSGEGNADIGFRSGVAYGYAAGTGAGGLFAGLGGTGAKAAGAAGNVTDITASAIASIVGGKGTTPGLAGTVDSIFLTGLVATAANPDGSFTNFGTANLVGSVVDPAAAGASTYKTGDGLIAAANLTTARDFTPEALLTLDANGALQLVDYRQPSMVPVVTPTP